MAARDTLAPPGTMDLLARHGDTWATVNDIVLHFSRLSWVPPHFPAFLAAHHIDAEALLELTEEDLRCDFFVGDPVQARRIIKHIDDLVAHLDPCDDDCDVDATDAASEDQHWATPSLPCGDAEGKETASEDDESAEQEIQAREAFLHKYGLDSETLRRKGHDDQDFIKQALGR